MILRTFLAFATVASAIPHPAHAATVTGIDRIEALCPGYGLPGLTFGADEAGQDKAALAALRQDWPLGEGEAQFTNWSDKLYAVEWRKDVRDGPSLEAWRAAIEDTLREQGWQPADYPGHHSLMATDSTMAQKVVGGRTLVIEYDTPGLQLLRCADLDLLRLDRREMDGELDPGSARPIAPVDRPFKLPDPAECARPELIEAFSHTAKLKEVGPTIERQFSLDDPALELAAYERRLGIWLKWKLRSEGGLDQEQIWDLERPAERANETLDETIALLGTVGQTMEAQQAKDPRKLCEASVDMLGAMHRNALEEAASRRKANAPLEAEARRLGLKLD